MDESTASEATPEITSSEEVGGEGFNIETASDDLAGDLFPQSASGKPEDDPVDTALDAPAEEAKPEVSARSAPKSWAKEMHEHYGKLDPVVQDYIDHREQSIFSGIEQYKEFNEFGKQMKQAIAPYEQIIAQEGLDAPRAVQALLNAHKYLRTSSQSDKQQYFEHLARSYGVEFGGKQSEQTQIDPTIKALMDKVSSIEGSLTQRQQAEREASYKKVMNEVSEFAADKANPYFDEVSDDIVVLLKTGLDLKSAYEKAVWANPVTRQKEIERINAESEATRTKQAQEAAQKAKAATAANVRNRDTRRTPTETNRATMRNLDDALRETQREINSRH